MIKIKDSQSRISTAKRTITVSDVSLKNGEFVDEEGSIVEKVSSNLPEGTNTFKIKISIELLNEEGNEE